MAQSLSTSRVEKWYAALVKIFVLIAIVLIGVIVYVSFTKTTVNITTQEQDDVITTETTVAELGGVVLLTDVEGSTDYDLTKTADSTTTEADTTTTTTEEPVVEEKPVSFSITE